MIEINGEGKKERKKALRDSVGMWAELEMLLG